MTAFRRQTQIRFAHCDPAGIVFFPHYCALVNEMVEDWFAGPLGRPFRMLHVEQRMGVPTVKLEAEFVAPARLGDPLEQTLAVTALGSSSCQLQHVASIDGAESARFSQTLAYVDLDAMRARPWPDDLRKAMTPFLIGDAA